MTSSSGLSWFLQSIPVRLARVYRNTLAANAYIEQNKLLKARFQKGAERPSIIWLSGMFGFVVAWVVTGLSAIIPIHVHTAICAGMLSWLITHTIILAVMLWFYRRNALLELVRYHNNRFMHRMFELAEERTAGRTASLEKYVTGIAQVNGDPMVVRCYALGTFTWLFTHQTFMFTNSRCHAIGGVFMMRPGGGVISDTVELADMFAVMNDDIITPPDQQHDEKSADVSRD